VSLRARLLAGLLAIAAVGLLALAAITYAEQRSFLTQRVDQQVRGGAPAVSHRLQEGTLFDGGAGGAPQRDGSGGHGGDGDDGPPRMPPGANGSLPPGTYGELRDASGKVLRRDQLPYGRESLADPKLPSDLPAGDLVTVGAKGGSGLRYRVLSVPTQYGTGTTVIAVPLREVDQTLARLLRVEAIVIAAVLIALAALSWLLIRIGLRPLDRIGRTAGQIAAGELSQRVSPATPRTEVGRLGLALNGMLARLEEAFAERKASEERLRRFIADASHELRTPLASIRGYAELFRIGAARDSADTEKAMRRIEDEAARMGVLVEDLLALARLDEVRDPVREPVDLAQIAHDAVADARVIAPERTVSLDADPASTVLGDPDQLRQVLANLMRNALSHTPASAAIEVSVARAGDDVALTVRDHGPGLPTDRPDELFERFWRAEGGRVRGRAGAGLGLAIVAAIVDGHGGTVEAATEDAGGARFTVRLPASSAAPAPSEELAASQ
jgi:two-component system OmpR family sensor kinase